MVLAKMMQQIAFLIMLCGTGYVAGIRNGGSGSSSNSNSNQNNYASSNADSLTSNFFPSQPLTMMPEVLLPAARQNEYNFRPSQLIEFTPSDATTTTTAAAMQNYASHVDAKYPKDIQFTFPSQQQQQPESMLLFNSNNYHTNTQSNKLNSEIPTQLQSTPILSYRDPYTNENYYHTPSPPATAASPSNRQEFTVHSSMMVHNHRYDAPPSSFPAQSYAATPASFGTSNYPQFSHKYDTPQYNQHPNALPSSVGYDRELPARKPTIQPPPKHISYNSKDYPPPSYYHTSNYLPPPQKQRQEYSSVTSSSVPNYANNNNNNNNNFGNYLQGEQYPQQLHQQQQQQASNYNPRPPSYTTSAHYPSSSSSQQYPPTLIRPQYQPSRGGPPPQLQQQQQQTLHNNNNNNHYFEYQQGEIPPPSYRPPYRPSSYPQQQTSSGLPDGLAQLASLYAPQFSHLLFGGGGGGGGAGGGSSTNALGSLLGAFAGGGGGGAASRPVNMQLIKALENIARNDDLQCVPKVLCQMIAGQTQRGQLPDFLTSPAITNFLSVFPAASPALIYGRAALLGISGGVRSCVQTYAQCPKNEDEILYYLNNHRGGFFKFFSEPEPEQQKPNQQTTSLADSNTPLLSILSVLTGNPVSAPTTTTTPRPRPRPTAASADITDGVGNFFSNILSNYLGGVEYQRRRRRRRRSLDTDYNDNDDGDDDDDDDDEKEIEQEKVSDGFHDEEDDEDTQYGDDSDDEEIAGNEDSIEGRILNKEITAMSAKFFPETEKETQIRNSFVAFNKEKASRKLKFPSATTSREYENVVKMPTGHRGGKEINFKDIEDFDAIETEHVNFVDDEKAEDNYDILNDDRRGKTVRFLNDEESAALNTISGSGSSSMHEAVEAGKIRFPHNNEDITRKGRILNRPTYAMGYADYVRYRDDDQDKFVVSDNKRRPHHYQSGNFGGNKNYNDPTYSTNSNRYGAAAHLNINNNNNVKYSNDNDYPRYEYPNNNYVTNNRYGAGSSSSSNSNYYQQSAVRTTSRPREDDQNVYVTNSKGMTEYYITPDGRKVYL